MPRRCDGGCCACRVDSPNAVRSDNEFATGNRRMFSCLQGNSHVYRSLNREGAFVPFNRINGFFLGNWSDEEHETMTLDDRNQQINETLEVRFSQLNSAIEAHETKLKKMMIARNVEYCYASWSDDDPHYGKIGEYQRWIGMIKQKGTWRLCHACHYESYTNGWPVEFDWKPLVDASVEDRIKAASQIESLREAIVKSKEKLVPELETAIESLAKTLEK